MGLHCAGKRMDGTFFMAADMCTFAIKGCECEELDLQFLEMTLTGGVGTD